MRLAPRTDFADARALSFEFPGLEVGVAEYDEGPTGCTVFHFPKVASLAIDVRGGSPGINGQHLEVVNAICFAGGSLYGLEASTGVAAELFKRRDYSTKWTDIALVSGAILFDFGARPNPLYPDQVHASMARGIQPFHARWDGDVSYMVSTQDVANADLDEVTLGEIASDAMWDAILASFGT